MIKFLIIEDDESARILLRTILKKNFACSILEADNGEKALGILKVDTPTIILLDVSMPIMDGNELLAILRSNPLYKKIPVVIISALSDKETAGSLIEKGICDYLLKPIDTFETIRRINKIVANLFDKNSNLSVEGLAKENFSAPRLLLVDNDNKSNDLFNKLLGDKFIIKNAKNGTEAINVFQKFYPRYIIVSDKIGLLDQRIITQKIREIATQAEVSIFLIASDLKAVSLKVFVFDGVIQRNENYEMFALDVLKKISSEEAVSNKLV